MGNLDEIDEKLDGLITSIKDLPTRDWVQKQMLQTQVDKINKATTIRVAIGGIVVTILIAVIQHFV